MRKEATSDRLIQLEFSSSTSTWEEIEDYATCIEGTITSLEEGGKEELVGRVRLFSSESDSFALTGSIGDCYFDRTIGAVMRFIRGIITDDVLGAQVMYDLIGDIRQSGK